MMAAAWLVRSLARLRVIRRLLGLSLALPLLSLAGTPVPFLVLPANKPAPQVITGRVVGVSDGDTLTLLDAGLVQHKIRLAGIDAPEKAQPFGSRAKLALSSLAYGREARANCGKPDRYGRQVCKIIVAGRDVNAAMIESGMAWHYAAYAKTQPREDALAYARAQDRARLQRAGLWTDAAPVAPWDWRRAKRNR